MRWWIVDCHVAKVSIKLSPSVNFNSRLLAIATLVIDSNLFVNTVESLVGVVHTAFEMGSGQQHYERKYCTSIRLNRGNVPIISVVLRSYTGLRKHLLDELEEVFPDEVEAYRMIRATSAAVAGNLLRLVPLFDKLVAIRIYVLCDPIPLLLQLSLDPLSIKILQIPLDRIWLMPCHPHSIRRLRSISYTYKFLNPLPA
nr:mediator of RNA polymerase II transcription subunit 10b-like [Ipomoea trifida]